MKNLFPYFAGSPPALVMSYSIFNAVISATSGTTLWWFLAFLGALAGVFGMIATEVYIYRNAARAFADKEYKTMAVMAAGGVVITGMMIYTVYAGHDTRSLVATSIAALVCYVAMGGDAYLVAKKGKRDEILVDSTIQADNQVKLLQAQTEAKKVDAVIERQRTLQANVADRIAKRQVSGVRPDTGQKKAKGLNPETLQKVRDYMQAHPDKTSVRDLEKAGIIGHSQAPEYIRAVNEQEQNK